ncbi:MAG: ABC transporter ATP-binding protein [Clostridia bacterium]|nr:ABC transporter ATP-binding protein [Clostridia bacterium]
MLLEVRNLEKRYPGFTLDRVSFSLESGYIMGFIGRNGAGKSTTMKSMLNLVHADGGEVVIDGLRFSEQERACKQKIGYVSGAFECYQKSQLRAIAEVTKQFYDEWDDAAYRRYLQLFSLDERKKVSELSAGMRVKFAIALALSHHAKLLILDEPTSGLDPVSRNELLDVFQSVIEDGACSIFYSTHIISDLEKCADFITYIRNGKILASTDLDTFRAGYLLVSGEPERLDAAKPYLIGCKRHAFGFTGLIHAADADQFADCKTAPADLESIMVYTEQEDAHEEAAC